MDDYHAADYDMVSEIPTKVSAPSTRRWKTGSRGCVRKHGTFFPNQIKLISTQHEGLSPRRGRKSRELKASR
jgi:hypothetical protein